MVIDSLLEPASSGHNRNCSFCNFCTSFSTLEAESKERQDTSAPVRLNNIVLNHSKRVKIQLIFQVHRQQKTIIQALGHVRYKLICIKAAYQRVNRPCP